VIKEISILNIKKWLSNNCCDLGGKTVAITGSTGGLGFEICKILVEHGADLILINRSLERSLKQKELLNEISSDSKINIIVCDLQDEESVYNATEQLKKMKIDVFFHNAGAYSIERKICKSGFDNVYTINFLAPYYMINELLPNLRENKGRVIAVSSIAHNYSKSNPQNSDFKGVKAASKAYGNAKRYLTFALFELFKTESQVKLSIAHPGITFTNITAHYPKLIFAIIKNPMKIIFMKPKKAAVCLIAGLFGDTPYHTWFTPKYFNIWGYPVLKRMKTVSEKESEEIFKTAQKNLENYRNYTRDFFNG